MIWIRADANKEIGTGHVMRCLSVAAELEKLGGRVCFLTADENPVPLFRASGAEYRILHSDYRYMEDEIEAVIKIFSEQKDSKEGNLYLADSYYVTEEYFRRIREYMPVAYVDDKGLTGLSVDVLINYNIFAEEGLYKELSGSARLLLGPRYAPLRKEFRNREYEVREKACRVLLTTGGADKYNLAGRFLERALAGEKTAELEYTVISGAYNIHLDGLRELEHRRSNIKVLSNVADMAEQMLKSDIAVTAGGSTMYELSAIGVPVLCFSFVDNQEEIVEGFVKRDLVWFGGNYLRQGEDMLEAAAAKLGELAEDRELRRLYSGRQRQVADGLGAVRIAEALTEAAREQKKSRKNPDETV